MAARGGIGHTPACVFRIKIFIRSRGKVKMNEKLLRASLCLGLALSCGAAHAATYEGGLLGHYLWVDSARENIDSAVGGAIDVVRLHNEFEGFSLRAGTTAIELDGASEPRSSRNTATVGYWRYLDGDGFELGSFRPYVNGAIGMAFQDPSDSAVESDKGLLLEAAFGLVSKWDAFVPNLKVRTEIRLEHEDTYAEPVLNVGVGLGVHYLFGAAASAPAKAPAPAPTPAPVAKPAPKPVPVAPKDSDGDGVKDDVDACPGTPAGTAVDAKGCVEISKFVLKGVSFPTGSSVMTAEAEAILRGVAETLKANPAIKVEVGGHTDAQGDDAKNLLLSERRAQSVKAFLVKEGVAADRVSVRGHGETKPVDSNDTAAGRANNRRVDFTVTAK